ncbi:FAD-dependent oxidoreductase [candidate division KSB1 bacterium]|nr:FAD-dependent oxidoreductase [candidate division KSB1 bacterium]
MIQYEEKRINLNWRNSNFPCMNACPVNTEAGRYVALIAEGRYEEAYRIARLPNPFASICGRICAAPCQDACTRGNIDKPIAIRALKRFVCEKYGVESMMDIGKVKDIFGDRLRSTGKWVAIVGGGPAGLTAAHDLALLGHQVTLFEAHDVLGGMLVLGIPEYRLPRELIRQEINAIINLGINVNLGKKLGRDFSIEDLQNNGFDAIFLAIGAHKNRQLNIDGIHADGVLNAIDYLLNINCGYRVKMGEKIVVIGGGNVAFDVARTAIRQSDKRERHVSDMVSALDVARSAVRFGAQQVEIICLESLEEIPADKEEIDDALRENIKIRYSRGPTRIVTDKGKVTGLETVAVDSVFDNNGRFNPTFIENSEEIIDTDSIITAIGQQPDLSFIMPDDELEAKPNNTIKVNPVTLETSVPGIWAGGDAAFGPRNVVRAVADGKHVAQSIHSHIMKNKTNSVRKNFIYVPDSYSYKPVNNFDTIPPQEIPKLLLERRTGIAQVELCFNEEQAQLEAGRCLHCWVNTIFTGNESAGTECILCGGCEDICPENCITIVPKRTIESNSQMLDELFEKNCENDSDFCLIPEDDKPGALILKDETCCIRCGLCAKRCPVDCISMEALLYKEAG